MSVPGFTWFLCMSWVCVILNHSVDPSIGDGTMTLLMMSTFNMTDISPLLVFTFWQLVYILLVAKEQSFPGKSKEVCSHFAGICEHIGHNMTFKILLDEPHEVICCSLVFSALDPDLLNVCLEPSFPADVHPTVKVDVMLEVEEKQRQQHLESLKKRLIADQTKQRKEFLDRVCDQLGMNASLPDPVSNDNGE